MNGGQARRGIVHFRTGKLSACGVRSINTSGLPPFVTCINCRETSEYQRMVNWLHMVRKRRAAIQGQSVLPKHLRTEDPNYR